MGDTTTAIVITVFGTAVAAYGVLLMVFAITGKGSTKKLEPRHRARLGCSAFMIIISEYGSFRFALRHKTSVCLILYITIFERRYIYGS